MRFREVKLTTLNKALLGRQPKVFDVFSFRSVVLSVFSFWHVFLFLSIIRIISLFDFRTRDNSGNGQLVREAHPRSTKGLELYSGNFLRLIKFCKKFEFDLLCNVTMLDANIATLKEVKNTSLCHVATLNFNVATLDFNVATLADHIFEPSL